MDILTMLVVFAMVIVSVFLGYAMGFNAGKKNDTK